MAWGAIDPNKLSPVKPQLDKKEQANAVEQTDDQMARPGERMFSTISLLDYEPSKDLIHRALRLD